jgi:hypothetical protein
VKAEEPLVFAAAELARSNPNEWNKFKSAMRAYADERTKALVASLSAELQVLQGRAQQSTSLADLFEDAVTTADRIVERRNNQAK